MDILSAAYLRYSLQGGGPGSGRHPGYGHGEMKKAIKGLNQRGWLAHERPKGFSLSHPDLPGHTIRLKNAGDEGMQWHHWAGRITHADGTNSHSLLQHVDEWTGRHNKVQNESTLQKALTKVKQLGTNETLRHVLDPEILDKLDDVMPLVEGLLPHLQKLGIHGNQDKNGNWKFVCK
jgi:hypothetical protein